MWQSLRRWWQQRHAVPLFSLYWQVRFLALSWRNDVYDWRYAVGYVIAENKQEAHQAAQQFAQHQGWDDWKVVEVDDVTRLYAPHWLLY